MNLLLQRKPSDENRTHGDLYILKPLGEVGSRMWECFSLEDPVKPEGVKIPGKTAIPAGRYRIIINYSPRFRKHLPQLLDVPNFDGVRMHAGNTEGDTEGCILVGRERTETAILRSRLALDTLMNKMIETFGNTEEVWIEVKNAANYYDAYLRGTGSRKIAFSLSVLDEQRTLQRKKFVK